MRSKPATIADYIAGLPAGRRAAIEALAALVRSSVPNTSGGMR